MPVIKNYFIEPPVKYRFKYFSDIRGTAFYILDSLVNLK